MPLLKELWNIFKYIRTPEKEREIIFYGEHEGYYVNFEGLINELTQKHQKTLCYITSDPNDPSLKNPDEKIKAFYLDKLLGFFMGAVKCKVYVMTMSDLNQFLYKRSVNPVHYVYVFHALVSTHMMYLDGAFDYYDTIMCVGPHQVKEIRKCEERGQLPQKKLIEAGYYRLERIHNAFQSYSQPSTSQKTILIAPSWGTDNLLESLGDRLVEILLSAGYKVIVRPHPETVRRSADLLESFKSIAGENPDFVLELSVSTDDSLLKSDVLICDCSGIALEYASGTQRPVLFVDVPLKIKNEKFEELGMEPLFFPQQM